MFIPISTRARHMGGALGGAQNHHGQTCMQHQCSCVPDIVTQVSMARQRHGSNALLLHPTSLRALMALLGMLAWEVRVDGEASDKSECTWVCVPLNPAFAHATKSLFCESCLLPTWDTELPSSPLRLEMTNRCCTCTAIAQCASCLASSAGCAHMPRPCRSTRNVTHPTILEL